MSDQSPLKHLLTIPYDELEELNLAAREKRDTVSAEEQEQEYRAYLEKEKHIKAVTLCWIMTRNFCLLRLII
jgi:glutamine synthetase